MQLQKRISGEGSCEVHEMAAGHCKKKKICWISWVYTHDILIFSLVCLGGGCVFKLWI